jgi:hypothetical protein
VLHGIDSAPPHRQHRPSLTHPLPCTPQVVDGRTDCQLNTPIGRPFSVETAGFKGLACLNMKGLPNTSGKCFEGKKRYLHLAFQVSPASTQQLLQSACAPVPGVCTGCGALWHAMV